MLTTLLLCAMASLVPVGGQDLAGSSDQKPVRKPFDASKWRLVWRDEFDKGDGPNQEFWTYEEGYVRNREVQYYTKDRRENARIEKGILILEARKDDWQGRPVTSASIHTSRKRPFLYGRIEARAKVPTGRGTWPAIWTLGENIREVGWPKCGEIDILENVGFDPSKVHANVHTDAYNHTKGNGKGNNIDVGKPWEGFHIYAVEWFPDRIEFFFDDLRYFVYRKESVDPAVWPFAQPHSLKLNLAIGGAWGGSKGVDDAIYPSRFEVDYVRYYEAR